MAIVTDPLLKAMTKLSLRPAIPVKDGTFRIDERSKWGKLASHRPALEKAIAATGRVETDDAAFPFVGTAFLIDQGRAVTANYVAESLAQRRDTTGKLRGVWLNLKAEGASGVEKRVAIDDFLLVHPYWGFAYLKLRDKVDAATAAPLVVAEKQSIEDLKGREICVIGYPAQDAREKEDNLKKILQGIFGVKRIMPGVISGAGRWGAEDSLALLHDATTTSGTSGAPLIDIATGSVLGIHVGGQQLVTNYAVPAWEIGRDPQWMRNQPAEPDSIALARNVIGAGLNERSIFSFEEVTALHQMLVDAGVTDETKIAVLFVGLPNEFVAVLPSQGAPSERLKLMLHAVNKTGGRIGGHSAFYYILRNSEAMRSWDEDWKKTIAKFLADVLKREAKT
jgi:hypothetical protein